MLFRSLEMAFAGRRGLDADLGAVANPIAALFAEELGAVIQVRERDVDAVLAGCAAAGLSGLVRRIGTVTDGARIRIAAGGVPLIDDERSRLHGLRTGAHLGGRSRHRG